MGVDCIVTGHNADDIAETVLMNRTPLCAIPRTRPSALSLTRRVLVRPLTRVLVRPLTASLFAPSPRPYPPLQFVYPCTAVLRGDVARLSRCTAITTDGEGTIPRCKPFKYVYEKEIVMYAYFRKLDYFSTECIYAPNAYRGYARAYLKDLEAVRPSAIVGACVRAAGPSIFCVR